MSNLIRRNNGPLSPSLAGEPFEVMRQMLDWDPFREMIPQTTLSATFVPQFDVKETSDGYLFKTDLPGVDEKDVDVSLTGNHLTISGQRHAEKREEGENYFACERSYGSFSRTFTLPTGIDAEHVEAELKNGVLTVHLPKTPEAKPRKISLKNVTEKVRGMFDNGSKATA